MRTTALVACYLGTFLSVFTLTRLALREHAIEKGKTLSQLAARNSRVLSEFRIILWGCGSLFAVALYGLILPSLHHAPAITIVSSMAVVCELLAGLVPDRAGWEHTAHNKIAFTMGPCMLVMAGLFAVLLSGSAAMGEVFLTVAMVVMGYLALNRREHFLYFELPFIFLSHFSILLAAIALY